MFANRFGDTKRGASNTFRSRGVADVVGGGLSSYQEMNSTVSRPVDTPFIFSNPAALRTQKHQRAKSTVARNLVSQFDQVKSSRPKPELATRNKISTFSGKDHFRTTKMEDNKYAISPRPVSAAPNRSTVAFINQKTNNLYERPSTRLYREYQNQKKWNELVKAKEQAKTHHRNKISQPVLQSKPVVDNIPEVQEEVSNIPENPQVVLNEPKNSEPIAETPKKPDVFIIEPKTADITPEKVSNLEELVLVHNQRSQQHAAQKLRGKLDLQVSQNYLEQKKLNEKIQKLQDQQIEKDLHMTATLQAERAHHERQMRKKEYADYAKHDLTSFLKSKDNNLRAFSKDRTNLYQTVGARGKLLEDQLAKTALIQHNARRNKFFAS